MWVHGDGSRLHVAVVTGVGDGEPYDEGTVGEVGVAGVLGEEVHAAVAEVPIPGHDRQPVGGGGVSEVEGGADQSTVCAAVEVSLQVGGHHIEADRRAGYTAHSLVAAHNMVEIVDDAEPRRAGQRSTEPAGRSAPVKSDAGEGPGNDGAVEVAITAAIGQARGQCVAEHHVGARFAAGVGHRDRVGDDGAGHAPTLVDLAHQTWARQ